MKNVSLVVLDIAGTTVSDQGNINEYFREAFASEGLLVSAEDVDQVMGYRKIEAVEMIVNKYSMDGSHGQFDRIQRIHEKFNKEMVSFFVKEEKLSPNELEEIMDMIRNNKS